MRKNGKAEWLLVLAVIMAIIWMIGSSSQSVLVMYCGFAVIGCVYWAYRHSTLHLAQVEYKKGNFEKVIELCDAQAKRFPTDAYAYALATYAALSLKQYEKAIKYSTGAIDLGADAKRTLLLRAQAYYSIRDFERCKRDATDAINIGGCSYSAYLFRSESLRCLYQYDEALMKDLDSKVMVETMPSLASILKATIFALKNQNEEALKEISSVMENIGPDRLFEALGTRAMIYCALGKIDLAIDDINCAIELAPDICEPYINRGFYYGRMGRLKDANDSLDDAAKLEGTIKHGYIESNRGRLLLLSGKAQKALESTTKAVESDEVHASIIATHGLMLLRNDRLQEANTFLDKAIELDPHAAEAYWFRAELHEKMGNTEQAEKDKKIASDYGYIPYL